MKPTGYHYTESGLDNFYLANGYREVESNRGTQVIIDNLEGLHRLIGVTLVNSKMDLSGRELRYLRQEMLMSQLTLAKLLSVSEQAIHRWEKGKTGNVPKPAESLVRLLYREHVKDVDKTDKVGTGIRSALKRLADLEDEMNEAIIAEKSLDNNWSFLEPKAA